MFVRAGLAPAHRLRRFNDNRSTTGGGKPRPYIVPTHTRTRKPLYVDVEPSIYSEPLNGY